MIYFDNAASAKPLKEAIDTAAAILAEIFANPNASHIGGIAAEAVITEAKKTLLSRLGLDGELIFTSGATESNNTALMSVKRGDIVTTLIEHPSVSAVLEKFADRGIIRVPPMENIADYVNGDTALVSVNAVCSETGHISDTPRIYAEIKRKYPDCLMHVDGSQGFLKTRLDGDLISLSAHKIGGVAGVGALFVRSGVKLTPLIHGGGQQKGMRSGTEPIALIAAFAKAAEVGFADTSPLRERLIDGLNRLPDVKLNVFGESVANIVNFCINGVKSEVMLNFLSERNICVSAGSACSRGKRSKILPAYGISDKDIDSAIRVSFANHNTVAEVDELLAALSDGIKRLRR